MGPSHKNQLHLREKYVKQKLLQMMQVTVPIFLFRQNLKNEAPTAQKPQNAQFFGPIQILSP